MIPGALLSIAVAAAGGEPDLRVSWDRHAVRFRLQAPAGHHLADALPASLHLTHSGVGWTGAAADLAEGVRLLRQGDQMQGVVEAGICEDASGTCTRTRLAFEAGIGGRAGRDVAIATRPAIEDTPAAPAEPHGLDSPRSLDAAMALAQTEGKHILIDFTAIWCPPCNQLSAEVLHDPADARLFTDLVLLEVDADAFDSWPLKDRYDVGGYPTLVRTDAAGEELDRLVGYPGEVALVRWLEGAGDRPALARLPEPDTLDATAAATLATRLCGVDRTADAAPFLDHAERVGGAPEHLLQTARLLVRQDVDAAIWLAANDEPSPSWLWAAYELSFSDPGLAESLLRSLQRAVTRTDPAQAATLLEAMAGMADARGDAGQSAALHAAAAATLGAALTGDSSLDRGHWTSLARLRARSGDVDGAVDLLRDAEDQFPDEMTFPHALAGILLRNGDAQDAVAAAKRAAVVAYGDNALRVANRLAKAQFAAGDIASARETLSAALRDVPAPGDARVRTPRYIQALRETQAALPAE
ncbi:MAG: thioredoxin family protein [Myxococcota bacterium]|nr:thioredoxin family protein [Myxococcota bacterium]